MFAENLLSVIDGHVMESIRSTPSYGSLFALLVVAEFETVHTSVLRKPDYEVKVAGRKPSSSGFTWYLTDIANLFHIRFSYLPVSAAIPLGTAKWMRSCGHDHLDT
jgi:hypothetical protein